MKIRELVLYLQGLPNQDLPVCVVNQHGDAREITSITLAQAERGMQEANNKQRIEVD